VLFGARPYTQSPLTLDHGWLMKNLERAQVGMIEDGTAVGAGLATAVNRLEASDAKSKIVILLTDGQNNAGKVPPLVAAETAKTLGYRVYTIGAGTRGSAPFPQTDAFGRRVYVSMPADIDEDTLRRVADTTGGRYFRATDTEAWQYLRRDRPAGEDPQEACSISTTRALHWLALPLLILAGGRCWRTWLRVLPLAMRHRAPIYRGNRPAAGGWRGRTRQRANARRPSRVLLPGRRWCAAGASGAARAPARAGAGSCAGADRLVLAGPKWGFQWQEMKREGLDIIVALDTSRSMLATDVKPNRLERAKYAVMDLVPLLRGDRIGLVAFAGTAFLECPLTLDYAAFERSLRSIEVGIIPRGGTAIARALETSLDAFEARQGKYEAIILITDGENTEGDVKEAAQRAVELGVKARSASARRGDLLPLKDGFVKDRSGQVVKSRLNEESLKDIALTTGTVEARASLGLDQVFRGTSHHGAARWRARWSAATNAFRFRSRWRWCCWWRLAGPARRPARGAPLAPPGPAARSTPRRRVVLCLPRWWAARPAG
jgi:Ca-activated chloride channel family protein